MPALAVGAAALVGGIYAANKQSKASNRAADIQADSAQAGIDEQRRQFDAVQQMLQPYVQAGTGALRGQMDLTGANGTARQQAAINALMRSPQFTSAQQLGEDRILAKASATGGLRGGNTQAALAQFNPALLASTINDQYTRLGGLTSIGQNAAAGVGNAGIATGNQVTSLLQQQGAALAGGALAGGRETAGYANALGGSLGLYGALGGFGNGAGSSGLGNWQASFSQTGLGSSGFGSGLAYGNQDLGAYF